MSDSFTCFKLFMFWYKKQICFLISFFDSLFHLRLFEFISSITWIPEIYILPNVSVPEGIVLILLSNANQRFKFKNCIIDCRLKTLLKFILHLIWCIVSEIIYKPNKWMAGGGHFAGYIYLLFQSVIVLLPIFASFSQQSANAQLISWKIASD